MRHKNVCVDLALVTLLVGALTVASPATAQDLQSSIAGLWKVTSVTTKIVSTGEMVHPFGERPSGYQMFTRGGHVMFSMFGENRATSAQPVPDVDRLALYNALVAYSGTYKVEGSKLIIHFEASATPGTVDRAYFAEISGNKLTLTSDPFTSGLTGRRIVTIRTFDRIE
jgi:Lipocalin-like domain